MNETPLDKFDVNMTSEILIFDIPHKVTCFDRNRLLPYNVTHSGMVVGKVSHSRLGDLDRFIFRCKAGAVPIVSPLVFLREKVLEEKCRTTFRLDSPRILYVFHASAKKSEKLQVDEKIKLPESASRSDACIELKISNENGTHIMFVKKLRTNEWVIEFNYHEEMNFEYNDLFNKFVYPYLFDELKLVKLVPR